MNLLKILLYILPLLTLVTPASCNIISLSITALSIIFGFVFTAICSIYNNDKFNVVIKHNNEMDKFVEDNKKFLKTVLSLLVLDFVLAILPPLIVYYKNLQLNFTQIIIYIGMIYMLFESFDFIENFFIVYKNSYSNYANSIFKKIQENGDK